MLSGKTVQVLTSISANSGALAMGAILAYSSPAGPLLMSGESSLTITEAQNGWMGAIVTLGASIGSIMGGYAMRSLGRRKALVYSLLLYLAGWIFIVAAQYFTMLIIGRIICGLCLGVTSVIVPTFIGEFSSADIRGMLTSCFQLNATIGELITYCLGLIFTNFRWLAVVCTLPAIVHSITIYFAKESPVHLLVQKNKEEAKKSLEFYRDAGVDVSKELEFMESAIEESSKNHTTLWDFRKAYLLKPLLILMALHFFQQASGVNALIFNMVIIFEDAGTNISSNLSAVIIALVLVVATAISTSLVERLGRKLLLIVSSASMTISLVPLGAYFFLKEQTNGDPEKLQNLSDTIGWIPLVSLMAFIAGFSIGYGPIPWIMMSEMFTSDAREVASTCATIANWFTAFIVTTSFNASKSAMGSSGTYWMYGGICGLSLLFSLFCVPETQGRRIEDIAAQFGHPLHSKDESQPSSQAI